MLKNKLFKSSLILALLTNVFGYSAASVQAQEEEDKILSFQAEAVHEGEAIEGGTVKYALVGDPFPGVLNNMYYTMGTDGAVVHFFNPGIYGYDENFTIDNSGFADIDFDPDNKQVTITIPEGTLWDDGEPLDIDDVIITYYTIGHPDYTGIRYGIAFSNVVGMEDYKNGDTDIISGLERIDDSTLRITYNEFTSSILQAGGGLSSYIEPEHIIKDIPVEELEDSDFVRQNPVGFGPFKVTSINPGESVTYEANEHYYKGELNVDGLTLEVVGNSHIVAELKAGNYDIASLPNDQYDTFSDATNFSIIGEESNFYNYIGFKMGTWDEEAGEVNFEEDRVVC